MLIPLFVAMLAAAPASEPATHETNQARLRGFIAAHVVGKDPDGAPDLPAPGGDALREWIRVNRRSLHGISQSELPEQPWGLSATSAAGDGTRSMFLYVFDWHASGRLVVYGLTGGVEAASLLADPDAKPLPFKTVGKSLVISVPRAPANPIATVVVLRLRGDPEIAEILARPAADGTVVLNARDAVVHGRTVRYEPEPHKDTIGYWTDPKDRVGWHFEVNRAGKYRVQILQGCGKGSGGSTVDFAVDDQVLKTVVEDTGGFQNFVARDIGVVNLKRTGRFQLTVTPKLKPGLAVMDLRQVTLVPVNE